MKTDTKVLILSDLNWERHLRSMRDSEVSNFTSPMINMDRYFSIKRYFSIIQNEKPHLVLLAGDITGDGSCGHGYHNPLKVLLNLIHKENISIAFISGNHDEHQYYDDVVEYVKEWENCYNLNNIHAHILGLNILGVPYATSHNKRKLKKLIKDNTQAFEIILCHSELKRRIWHFDFNTKLVATGHYDRKLCMIDNSVFISLDNDSNQSSYASIVFSQKDIHVTFNVKHLDNNLLSYQESYTSLKNDRLNEDLYINRRKKAKVSTFEPADDNYFTSQGSPLHYLKYLRGQGFKMSAEYIRVVKKNPNQERPSLLNQMLHIPITPLFNCTKSMVNDYLGKRV